MAAWIITMLLISVTFCDKQARQGLTTLDMMYLEDVKNVAGFGDAQHRGPDWYAYKSMSSNEESLSDLKDGLLSSSSSISTGSRISTSSSSDASSVETKEKRKATQVVRNCVPCPHDMLKNYKNLGIKWICGGYQRARRSFKSACMMRYRNCQDGTMFVKLYDHRCQNNTYHGRHWFYIYRV